MINQHISEAIFMRKQQPVSLFPDRDSHYRFASPSSRWASGLLWLSTAILLLFISVQPSEAAVGFNIQPLRLDMSARSRTSSLELTNLTDKDIPVQIKVLKWSQEDGKDVLVPTRDIFLAPPITNVKASGKQVIRFRLKKGADVETEKSYRVYVEQIPPSDPRLRAGMEFRIRFSVPLFISPIRYSEPQFTVTTRDTPDGIAVKLQNSGNIHLRVKGITVHKASTDESTIKSGQNITQAGNSITNNAYTLPGTSQEWLIKLPAGAPPAETLKLGISTDYYNASGKGLVKSDGLIWVPIDGKTHNSAGHSAE